MAPGSLHVESQSIQVPHGGDGNTPAADDLILRECSIRVVSSAGGGRASGRYFRIHLQDDQPQQWEIHELWLRGVLPHAPQEDPEIVSKPVESDTQRLRDDL